MLPYGRQSIDDDDIRAVEAALRGDFLTGGPAVDQFEAGLAAVMQSPHVVVCSNGTAALHLAMMALQLGPGDALVVPSLTFLATANAARYVGADVWFADVDPETGLMTPETLLRALKAGGPGTVRAVAPVHLNGQSVDLEGISGIARHRGLSVVEDACHALGGFNTVDGERSPVGHGAASDMACFSFHPVKTIAMGEGGAISTRDPVLAERLRRFRNHGMTKNAARFTHPEQAFAPDGAANSWYYEMPEPGYNYRAPDINCALGVSQLQKLSKFLDRRRYLAALYDRLLSPLAPMVRPVPRVLADDGLHLYPVLIDFAALGRSRADVMKVLQSRGIGTQVHYLPVHRQPYYRKHYPTAELSGADAYYSRCLSIPLYPALADADVEHVVDSLSAIVAGTL